jgi:WD40 repeat protein
MSGKCHRRLNHGRACRSYRHRHTPYGPHGQGLGGVIWPGRQVSRIRLDARSLALGSVIEFSPDGSLLAYSGEDGLIIVRQVDDWSVEKTIPTNAVDLISISFSKDGKRLAAASLDGPIDVWTLPSDGSASMQVRVPAKDEKRWKAKYSPDGTTLAIASWDGTVSFWDAETLQYRGTIDGSDERVNDIAFAANQDVAIRYDGSRCEVVRSESIYNGRVREKCAILVPALPLSAFSPQNHSQVVAHSQAFSG